MLDLLASNVASDLVFTSKKRGVLVDDSAAKTRSSHNLAVCMCFHCFHIFHVLHIFQIGQRRGVLRVSMLFSIGVQLQLDGWPWNGEGVLGAKGMWGKHSVLGVFQPRQGLNVNLK